MSLVTKMARKPTLPPVDACKVLIGDLDIRDLESVIQYAKYILADKRRVEKDREAKK